MPVQTDLTDLSQIIAKWIQIPPLELLARLFVRAPANLCACFRPAWRWTGRLFKQ